MGFLLFSMWMRRNASVRNGGQQEPPFNPNHRRYRTCCCHCKTFTLGFGIVELFLICFMLVAVAPDFNSKICAVQHQNEWNGTGTTTMTTLSSQMESTLTSTTSAVVPMGGVINSVAKRRKRQAIEVGNSLVQNPNMEVIALLAQKMSSSITPTTSAEIAESEQNGMEDSGQAKNDIIIWIDIAFQVQYNSLTAHCYVQSDCIMAGLGNPPNVLYWFDVLWCEATTMAIINPAYILKATQTLTFMQTPYIT